MDDNHNKVNMKTTDRLTHTEHFRIHIIECNKPGLLVAIVVAIVNSLSVTVSIKSGAHHCYCSGLLLENI